MPVSAEPLALLLATHFYPAGLFKPMAALVDFSISFLLTLLCAAYALPQGV